MKAKNGATAILLITPKNEEINQFRRRFYSFRSLFKRMAVSKTNLAHNLIVNLGHKWSL